MDVDYRGKFGCHHISLYVEKYKKANRIPILSKMSSVIGKSFFSSYYQVIQYQVIYLEKMSNLFSKFFEIDLFLAHISER